MLDQILQYVSMAGEFLSSSGVAKAIGVVVSVGAVETICRLAKTEKPIGILIAASAILKKLGKVGRAFASFCDSADGAVDKLIPQRLKPAEAPKPPESLL